MNDAFDKWIQRAAIAFMLAIAAGLVGTGVVLYAPSHVEAARPAAAR